MLESGAKMKGNILKLEFEEDKKLLADSKTPESMATPNAMNSQSLPPENKDSEISISDNSDEEHSNQDSISDEALEGRFDSSDEEPQRKEAKSENKK